MLRRELSGGFWMQSVDGWEKVIQRDVTLGSKHVIRVTSGASGVPRIRHSQSNYIPLLPWSKTLTRSYNTFITTILSYIICYHSNHLSWYFLLEQFHELRSERRRERGEGKDRGKEIWTFRVEGPWMLWSTSSHPPIHNQTDTGMDFGTTVGPVPLWMAKERREQTNG